MLSKILSRPSQSRHTIQAALYPMSREEARDLLAQVGRGFPAGYEEADLFLAKTQDISAVVLVYGDSPAWLQELIPVE